MTYQLRVILDTKEDIFKDILIDENKSLFDLHSFIKNIFSLPGKELASIYLANDNWEQNEEEIPLENLTDEEDVLTMKDYTLKQLLTNENDRLIYVYDLLYLWTFFVELVKIETSEIIEDEKVVFSYGEVPKEAPEKQLNFDDKNNFNDLEEDEDSIFDEDDSYLEDTDLDGLSTYDSDEYN